MTSKKSALKNLRSADRQAFFRYLPVSAEAKRLGAYVTTAGYQMVQPNDPYPPYRHPTDHHFTWENGRILSAYQLVYITKGAGEFESRPSGNLRVAAGNVIVVFPGVWHRYRPQPDTGWDEYWVELGGTHVTELLKLRPLDSAAPILTVGHDEALLRAFLDILDVLRHEPPDYPLVLGTLALTLLARTSSALKHRAYEGRPSVDVVRQACAMMERETGRRLPLAKMAAQLGVSYSSFRRLFKAHTGLSARQYAMQLNLRRASDLLAHTRLPVSRIAETLGFESVFYFSRFLKNKTGFSPINYRRLHQADK